MVSANAAIYRKRDPGSHAWSLIKLIKEYNYRTVAEIGVWKCATAIKVLSRCVQQLDAYHLVDPWQQFGVEGATGEQASGRPGYVDWEGFYKQALWLRTKCPAQVHLWRMSSVEAARQFQPESLDLVFIDADHSYRAVKDDIEAWLPIVRAGGILAGHDYEQEWPGVIRAVDELLEGVQFLPDTVWYVVK